MTPAREPSVENRQRGLFKDLTDPRWIKAKGALFLVAGLLAAGLLLIEHPGVIDAALLLICVWSFCRVYYILPSTSSNIMWIPVSGSRACGLSCSICVANPSRSLSI